MKKIILKIKGMTCSACSNHIEKYLKKQDGIIDVSVNLVLSEALIYYNDNISIETLATYINNSGYTYGGIYNEKEENKKDYTKTYLIILSILLLLIMYITMSHMIGLPQIPFLDMKKNPKNYSIALFLLTIPYLIYGRNIIKNGLKNLINKSPNMDSLIFIGVLISFTYSFINMLLIIFKSSNLIENLYFESVCMVILFVSIGKYIDSFSKDKVVEAIKDLVRVTPEKALIKHGKEEKEITIDEVKVGDTLIVKPGMKVAVDGTITKGSSHFDESFITGESNRGKKQKGDKIVAGSFNYDGVVEYKAEKIGPKSTISEMVHLVLEASNSKLPISKVTDKVCSYFVPFIIILSILTLIAYLILNTKLNEALIHVVSVLLVACPCALGLAAPLGIITSIGTSLKNGILIKSSETLEITSKIDTIIFDKTGTLSYGTLKLNKLYNYSNYNDETLLNIVASIENNSSHPIASSLKKYKTKELKITDYKELSGLGLTAKINKKEYLLGNSKILKNIPNTHEKEEKELTALGNSIIYIVENNKIIGLIGVKDTIKKDAKSTIKKLQEQNLNVIMLSGDNEITASIIAKELGIKNVYSNCLPTDKTKYIKELKSLGKKVIMVGDGINDAPSLMVADIGISFKNSTDIATNSANVIITNNSLENILLFLKIGKQTIKNIKQNLFWAFFYNALMIPIAMGLFSNIGINLNPMLASASMMLSSITVVLNALRLRKIH